MNNAVLLIALREIKYFSHKVNVNINDNRLINSLYQSVKVKVTDKRIEEWRLK